MYKVYPDDTTTTLRRSVWTSGVLLASSMLTEAFSDLSDQGQPEKKQLLIEVEGTLGLLISFKVQITFIARFLRHDRYLGSYVR